MKTTKMNFVYNLRPDSKELPILMSTWSVGGILSGYKTETRRPLNPQPPDGYIPLIDNIASSSHISFGKAGQTKMFKTADFVAKCRYGRPMDTLYVRETWAKITDLDTTDPGTGAFADGCFYKADHPAGLWHDNGDDMKWRPSIHMPKELARIRLRVSEVNCERLQDITREGMLAEGLYWNIPKTHRSKLPIWDLQRSWIELWNDINAGRGMSWGTNPWVFVVKFEKL